MDSIAESILEISLGLNNPQYSWPSYLPSHFRWLNPYHNKDQQRFGNRFYEVRGVFWIFKTVVAR